MGRKSNMKDEEAVCLMKYLDNDPDLEEACIEVGALIFQKDGQWFVQDVACHNGFTAKDLIQALYGDSRMVKLPVTMASAKGLHRIRNDLPEWKGKDPLW